MQFDRPKCLDCKHFKGGKKRGFGLICDAFPDGIPEDILLGKHDHAKPYQGDHGILYEPLPGVVKTGPGIAGGGSVVLG